jgi:outer membrane protein OmpA-like peptidoglycan-associated protein
MKAARIALGVAAAGLFSACAYVPPKEDAARRVSPDYMATGGVEDARAYVYGSVTLFEFGNSAPSFVTVWDASGESVEYERVGRYYRLARVLDNFTVWANGQSVTFAAPMTTRVFSAPIAAAPVAADEAKAPEVVKVAALEVPASKPGDEDVAALLKLCENQLADVRRLLEQASTNPKATGQELFDVNARLDEIEARMVTAAAAIVKVSFPTGSTAFKPNPEVAEVLIASGKAADRVNVRGRTDSRVAGPLDAKMALGRAMAARKFLVDHGVSAEKIRVFSQADGDFAAPNVTKEGRSLNRRVEIEFVNARIAELKGQSVKLASNQ